MNSKQRQLLPCGVRSEAIEVQENRKLAAKRYQKFDAINVMQNCGALRERNCVARKSLKKMSSARQRGFSGIE